MVCFKRRLDAIMGARRNLLQGLGSRFTLLECSKRAYPKEPGHPSKAEWSLVRPLVAPVQIRLVGPRTAPTWRAYNSDVVSQHGTYSPTWAPCIFKSYSGSQWGSRCRSLDSCRTHFNGSMELCRLSFWTPRGPSTAWLTGCRSSG